MKKIAFVSSRSGGPKVSYENLLNKGINNSSLNCEIFSSISDWIKLHFIGYKYDIIISSIPFLWKPYRTRFILNINGFYHQEKSFSLPGILNKYFWINYFFASDIVYPSIFIKNKYENKHMINHVIYPIVLKNHIPKPTKEHKTTFITVTSFSFYEKARGILDIFEKLEGFSPTQKIKYYIIGDGKFLTQIQKKQGLYILHKNIEIHFLGRMSAQKIPEYISHKSIFLYSSFQDTFGISIVEAIQRGAPILLNNYELFTELYNKELRANNKNDFQQKLQQLLVDNTYADRNTAIAKKDIEKFNSDLMLEKWEALFST